MRIAVIGGGISGIASAFYLTRHNVSVDLFESDEQLGGRAGSEKMLDRWVDFGGKNIGRQYKRFREFAKSCGNPDFEYFGINTSQLINGRIVSLNRDGAKFYNLLKLIKLCGIPGVVKLYPHIKAILDDRTQGVLCSDYFSKLSERLDHVTLAEYLNKPCVNNIIRPITIRMNGAEPEECYPGNFGSNLALAVDSYEQLITGMYELVNTFISSVTEPGKLRVLKGHRVTAIRKDQNTIRLEYRHQDLTETNSYDRVISALPAHNLASLLEEQTPVAARLLRKIRYYPVGIAIVKYRNEVFPKERRAMIFDRNTALSNAGAYGLNDLDIVRYTFSGKTARKDISENSAPEKVIGFGEKITAPYFNIIDNPREAFVYRYFSKGLCAYASKHHLLLESIDEHISKHLPGLTATGDYRRGASIEACFRAASECVDNVIGDQP
ncbi:MAG: FAD-dependent oxidoreductase [Chlorobiaceae bacterium]|nr:FAD-dependent oxidoreductase [Chlorobiaceae bacterium]